MKKVNIDDLLTIELKTFVRQHFEDDVFKLALSRKGTELFDFDFALDQISGRKIAHYKLPSWYDNADIVYPPHLSMEQCSSEETARYKAEIVSRLLKSKDFKTAIIPLKTAITPSFVDLTGGFGVDFAFMSFGAKSVYVERQEMLCQLATHNFKALGIKNVEIVNLDSYDYVNKLTYADIIFLDPARRSVTGSKVFNIVDCFPNLLNLKDELTKKSKYVIVKLSPMLDWHKAVSDLNKSNDIVREVHCVSVKNECKELIVVLSSVPSPLTVYCVNDDNLLKFSPSDIGKQVEIYSSPTIGQYLYEPNSSIMKIGCFSYLTEKYQVRAISSNSHLFTSQSKVDNFSGRCFIIEKVIPFNKKVLRKTLSLIKSANVITRNFPLSALELRKFLKIKDGSSESVYIFGTTDSYGKRLLLLASKA